MYKSLTASAAVVTALLAAPALAAGSGLPAPNRQGDVAYLTGGATADEARAMEREASRYSLTLELVRKAQPADLPAGNVKVSIRDAATGKVVLDTATDGRYLLAQLPAGRYVVATERGSDLKTQRVTLDGRHPDRLLFSWK
jgi:hypothetical protein